MNFAHICCSAVKLAGLRAPAAFIGALALLLNLVTGDAIAGTFDNALGRTAYVAMTGDVNGDGQNDVLLKASAKMVMIPLDDDLTIPIRIPAPSPTFALISTGFGGYALVENPNAEILASTAWKPATQQITFAGPAGAFSASVTITAASSEQASFVVSTEADTGQLQLTSTTPAAANSQPQLSSATPVPVTIEPPHLGNPNAGSLPGSLGVGENGAATYSIPLAVPPGTGGMTPSLALNYSSNGSNGLLGLGWSLQGMSTIHRCAKTIAQDGTAGRINFDNADRLCLDGQRLVRSDGANPGADVNAIDTAYWASGAEYRTELESFTRVTNMADGSFKTETKDGRIHFYGKYRNDAGSTIAAQGRSDGKPLLWALGGTEDRVGNYLTVEYTQDATTGEYLPRQLRYGGHGPTNQATDLAIRFSYEARGDAQPMYMGGSHNDMRNRLTHIQTFVNTAADGSGGSSVRDHTVHYIESSTSGRSLVDWMQACATNPVTSISECLPKTTFDTGVGGTLALTPLAVPAVMLPVLDQSITYPTTGFELPARYQGDLDGSGRTSFIVNRVLRCDTRACMAGEAPNVPHKLKIMLPSGVEFEHELDMVAAGFTAQQPMDMRIGDLNGDGRDDLVLVARYTNNNKWGYCLNTPATDGTINFNCQPAPAGGVQGIVDLNKDGKMDVIAIEDNSSSTFPISVCSYVNGAMQCTPIAMRSIPSPTVPAMPMLFPALKFGIGGINLSRNGASDMIATWTMHVPAADPAHGYRIYSGSTYKLYDVSVGAATCFYRQDGLACQAVYNQIIPGDQAYRVYTSSNQSSYTVLTLPTMHTGASIGDLNGDGLTDFGYGVSASGTYREDMPHTYTTMMSADLCLSKEFGTDCHASSVLKDGLLNGPFPGGAASIFGQIGDFMGDGVQRMILSDGASAMKLCRYAGASLVCQPFALGGVIDSEISQNVFVDDGGIAAFLTGCNNQQTLQNRTPCTAAALTVPPATDKIIGVTNGMGLREEVDYARGNDGKVYRRFVTISGVEKRPVYPQATVAPGVLVKQLRKGTGQGTWLSKNYFYEGLLADEHGRGLLGFAAVHEIDALTNISTVSSLNQTYPFVGTVLNSKTYSRNTTLKLEEALYEPAQQVKMLPSGAKTIFSYTKKSTVVRKDLYGSDINTTTTDSQYEDGWGNLTGQNVNVAGGGLSFTSSITSSFVNNSAQWLIGLPATVASTKRAAGFSDVTRSIKYEHHPVTGQLTKETVEPNNIAFRIVTEYDRSQNSFGLVNITRQTWRDPDPSSAVDVTRRVTDIAYDAKGRFPLTTKNPLGHTATQAFYAGSGARNSTRDSNQRLTTWQVDGFGRITAELRADGNETRTYRKQCSGDCPAYAVSAEVSDTFHAAARITSPTVVYSDAAGHVVRNRSWGFDGRSIVADQRYDAQGRAWESDLPRYENDAAYLAQRLLYDDLNRNVEIVKRDERGAEHSSTTTYNGLVTVHVNSAGQRRTETRDARLLLRKVEAQVRSAQGSIELVETRMHYEPFGNLISTIDPNGNVITVNYDQLGRKIALIDPDLGRIEYGIDPAGRTWKQISPKQRLASALSRMRYDALDRMTARYETDLESHWDFDTATNGIGQLAEAYTRTSGSKDYHRVHSYDSAGRPTSISQAIYGVNYTSEIAYDTWGRAVTNSYKRGKDGAKVFGLRYNNRGYLERLERGPLVLWKAESLDAMQRVTKETLGNGLTQTRHYNAYAGYLSDLALKTAANELRVQQGYHYDTLGNVTKRTQYWNSNGFIEDFNYDELNRLTLSKVAGHAAQVFEYDLGGNIRAKTGLGSYSYPAQGAAAKQPHAVQNIAALGSFGYDENGNLTSGAGRTALWTSFDMPRIVTKNGVSASFVYGPEHQRTRQIRGDGSMVFYAGAQEVDMAPSGALTVKTNWPAGVGVEIDRPGAVTELNWVNTDRLGSPIAISDKAGALREKLAYDAWGKRRTLDGNAAPDNLDGRVDNRGFTGHEMLDQLDLVHMNGRIFDPLTGRFLSGDPLIEDPMNGQSYNRYSYVFNNPTNLTDPTGFKSDRDPTGLGDVHQGCGGGAENCVTIWINHPSAHGKGKGDKAQATAGTRGESVETGSANSVGPGSNYVAGLNPALPPVNGCQAGMQCVVVSAKKLDASNWTDNLFAKGNHVMMRISDPICHAPSCDLKKAVQALNSKGVHPNQRVPFAPGRKYQANVDIPGPFGEDNIKTTAVYDKDGNQIGVRNETLFDHVLYPGVAERTIIQTGNAFRIRTQGGGYGYLGGPNIWLPNLVWGPVDSVVAKELQK